MSELGSPAPDGACVTRVLLVEDHLAFAQALRAVLDLEDGLEVVGTVSRADEAGTAAAELRPDVVVVDLDLAADSGREAILAIRAVVPDATYLVLTALRDRIELGRVVEVGVSGLLHKSAEIPAIIDAIRAVGAGRHLLSPEVTADLLGELRRSREASWRAEVTRNELSSRELEVLTALTNGDSITDIARMLHISTGTVETHLKNARAKLGASSRLEAVVEALRLGLVDPPDRLPGTG